MKHTKITKTERELLSQWKKEEVANKEIARRLGRPVITVLRELKRNKTRVAIGKNDWEYIYEPTHAQHIAVYLTPCQGPIIDTIMCFFRIDYRPN